MIGREVAAVVRVEYIGDAAHDPASVLFAPNCLTQRQGRVQRRRIPEGEKVPGYSPAVVVDYDTQPWLGGLSVRADQQNIERRVVGLPSFRSSFHAKPSRLLKR